MDGNYCLYGVKPKGCYTKANRKGGRPPSGLTEAEKKARKSAQAKARRAAIKAAQPAPVLMLTPGFPGAVPGVPGSYIAPVPVLKPVRKRAAKKTAARKPRVQAQPILYTAPTAPTLPALQHLMSQPVTPVMTGINALRGGRTRRNPKIAYMYM